MGCVTCKQCGDEINLDRKTYEFDEGMDLYFCDVECQLSFYQSEYDRIITEKETWKRECLLLQAKNTTKAIFTEPFKEIDTQEMKYKYWIRACYIQNGDIESTCFLGDTEAEVCDKRDKFLKAIGAK